MLASFPLFPPLRCIVRLTRVSASLRDPVRAPGGWPSRRTLLASDCAPSISTRGRARGRQQRHGHALGPLVYWAIARPRLAPIASRKPACRGVADAARRASRGSGPSPSRRIHAGHLRPAGNLYRGSWEGFLPCPRRSSAITPPCRRRGPGARASGSRPVAASPRRWHRKSAARA